jgi:hypothetical protein
MDRPVGRWRIVNPGTVGVPLDGDVGFARYAVLDSVDGHWRVIFRRAAYDLAPVFQEFARLQFAEECGVVGHLIVDEFRAGRLQLLPFLRWHAAHYASEPYAPELLTEFRAVDPWPYVPPAYHVNL